MIETSVSKSCRTN